MSEVKIRCSGAEELSLDQLKKFKGNPKKISRKDLEKLINVILELGFIVPFFLWRVPPDLWDDSEERIDPEIWVLDGHQRLAALEEMKVRGIRLPDKFPVIYIEAKNMEQAKKTLGAISSQYGQYDKKLLRNFFDGIQVDNIKLVEGEIKIKIEPIKLVDSSPEIEITSELLESHNYVVLYFDNDVDWQTAQEKLGLKPVKALKDKPGFKMVGTGRVLRGASVIDRL
jgi:hypothetical protein